MTPENEVQPSEVPGGITRVPAKVDEEAVRLQAIRQAMLEGKPVQRHDALLALAQIQDIAWWDDEPLWLPLADGPLNLQPGEIVMRDPATLPREVWARHKFNVQAPGAHGLNLAAEATFVAIYRGALGVDRVLVGYKSAG